MRFTENHDWLWKDSNTDIISVGVTGYATVEFGDITALTLPDEGDEITEGEVIGSISADIDRDFIAPISGTVVEINPAMYNDPGLANEFGNEDAWMIKIDPANAGEYNDIWDKNQYKNWLETLE